MRAVIDAAVELFSEEGYATVSTRRVAEVAGCSETLLFRYFGGKRGLLLAICNDLAAEPLARPEPVEFESLSDYLEHYFVFILDVMSKQGPRLKIVASAIVSDQELSAEFEKRHDADVAGVAERLRVFQEAGAVAADVDVYASAAAIQQTTFTIGLLLQVVYEKPRHELLAIAQTFARAFSVGLRGDIQTTPSDAMRRQLTSAALGASQALDSILDLMAEPTP